MKIRIKTYNGELPSYLTSDAIEYIWSYDSHAWFKPKETRFKSLHMKPITKEEGMKEYLIKSGDGQYLLTHHDSIGAIEVPEGAIKAYLNRTHSINFVNADDDYMNDATKGSWVDTHRGRHEAMGHVLVWQRPTTPEKPSLNDQVATAEVARQSQTKTAWDTQVGGDHYKQMVIQPMEFALKNKLDYAQANVVKYVTRHAHKNGKQDLLKAIHNIELMIEHYYGE